MTDKFCKNCRWFHNGIVTTKQWCLREIDGDGVVFRKEALWRQCHHERSRAWYILTLGRTCGPQANYWEKL